MGEGSEESRTFVLGVGAQNAGTTWLCRYLHESPEFAAGYRREYHVFDTLDLESEAWWRNRVFTLAETALTELRAGRPADAAVLHRMSMVGNPAYYYDYFASLLRQQPGRRVTADVTPAYALLSVDRLREIRRELAERGVRAVAVFLMRDPVDRIWSQVRMQHQRIAAPGDPSAEERMLEWYADPQYTSRSHYHRTIDALDEAFGEDVHFEFYEGLFTPDAVSALTDAIGISMHPPAFERRIDEAAAKSELSEGTQRVVAERLSEVYPRVAARFPDVDLTAIWPSARVVL